MANYCPNIRKRRVCTVLASLNCANQAQAKSSTSTNIGPRVCGMLFTSSKGSKYPVVGKMHASKREVRPNYLAMDYLMFR